MSADTHGGWQLYVIRCGDGALYTGITTDLARRLEEHARGGVRGARRLRGRGPLHVAYATAVESRSVALRAEHALKRLARADKERIVREQPPAAALLARLRVMPAQQRASNRPTTPATHDDT